MRRLPGPECGERQKPTRADITLTLDLPARASREFFVTLPSPMVDAARRDSLARLNMTKHARWQHWSSGRVYGPRRAVRSAGEGGERFIPRKPGLKQLVKLMPNGPDKQAFGDYLLTVQTALNELRQVLYEVQANDSKLSSISDRLNLQLSMDKISYQKKKMDEMKNQHPKGGPFAAIAKFFAKLGVFGIVMGFLIGGPIVGMLMLLRPTAWNYHKSF